MTATERSKSLEVVSSTGVEYYRGSWYQSDLVRVWLPAKEDWFLLRLSLIRRPQVPLLQSSYTVHVWHEASLLWNEVARIPVPEAWEPRGGISEDEEAADIAEMFGEIADHLLAQATAILEG